MFAYIIRRILYVVPIGLGVTVLVFALVHIAPGDPISAIVPPDAPEEMVQELRKAYGFDRPLPIQYATWLGRVLIGDLGRSVARGREVVDELTLAVPNTLILAVGGTLLGFTLGAFFGGVAGYFQGRWIDKLATATAITGVSVPHYWLGLVLAIIFSVEMNVLPSFGMGPGAFKKQMGIALLVGGRTDQGEPRKRRPVRRGTLIEGNLRYTLIAALDEALPKRMLGKCGLHEDFAAPHFAAGTTCDLHDGLRHTLIRAKIRAEQSLVRIDDTDQRELRKMMSLRQHLGPHKNICIARRRGRQCRMHCALALRAVAVDTHYRPVGKTLPEGIFKAFGTGAQRANLSCAFGTGLVEWSVGAAVMTAQLLFPGVYGHARVTAKALGDMSAARADQCRGKAAAIQIQQHLAVVAQVPFNGLDKRFAQAVIARRMIQVNEPNRRRFGLAGSFGQ